MKRFIIDNLIQWKDSANRKPLILQGARQVGKSYIINRLFREHFKSFIEVNFEKRNDLVSIFEGNLDAKGILSKLETILRTRIIPGETLLFLDEIQAAPRAILALRYLYEEIPQLHVIAAGSLLQFAIEKVGTPVGRVTFRWVSPLTFEEFLANNGNSGFLNLLEEHDLKTPLGTSLHQQGLSLLAEYMAVGGMPEVVNNLIENHDYLGCESRQQDILEAFRNDFPKYANIDSNLRDVGLVYERAPHLVAKNFKFVHISREVQSKYLRSAIDALSKAGLLSLIYQCHSIQAAASYDPERYKILFLDLGLVQRATNLPISEWIKNRHTLLNQGTLAEQFVGQQLSARGEYRRTNLYYWERMQKNSSAEVDFLVLFRDNTIPVEVKSGKHGRLKSLHLLLESDKNIPYGVKTSTDDFGVIDRIRSIPLYAFGTWLKRGVE